MVRWVASHDPVNTEDRQITLLESLSVNMEQVRSAVTAVNEYLTSEVPVPTHTAAFMRTPSPRTHICYYDTYITHMQLQ